jgi:beta-D-xylosidase 4
MRPGPPKFARPDCATKTDCRMGTNPGRTHRFYTGKAVVPFGYGLSYTTFDYKLVSAPTNPVSLDAVRAFLDATENDASRQFPSQVETASMAPISYVVNVTNTGSIDADHVVLGMAIPPDAGVDGVPLQELWGFERVFVPAGKTITVEMYPALTSFTQVNGDGLRNAHTGEYTFRFGIPEMRKDQGYLEHAVQTF